MITSLTIFLIVLNALLLLASYTFFSKWQKAEARKQSMEQNYHHLESKINSLKLQNLESILNPHLFKNTLNSIQSHAYQTYHALDKMSNVLDYILYESHNKLVTPQQEIEFALNLIEIYKIKISPLFELKVKTKIDESDHFYNQEVVAPLITIDLIENAFKHADIQSADAFISITFEFKNNTLSLAVANKISQKIPLKKQNSGIGSETLEERLKIIYQDAFQLDRYTENDNYFAHLKINLLEYKTKMLATR